VVTMFILHLPNLIKSSLAILGCDWRLGGACVGGAGGGEEEEGLGGGVGVEGAGQGMGGSKEQLWSRPSNELWTWNYSPHDRPGSS
jgi:hypothetical protein